MASDASDSSETATWATGEPTQEPIVDLSPGAAFDAGGFDARYDDVKELGKGGMGEVRLVHDKRLGRDVAVKLSHKGQARSAFVREALVQGQLEHPSIAPVYDLGARATGEVYFTMKRVRGMTLREILAEEREAVAARLPPQRSRRSLLSALSRVCLTMDYAHGRGVVHRDLKPNNVMLGDYGEVYVLDWGIAKVTEAKERETLAGGTPGYMAPEQASGGAVDARADVYALGAILFEILTLERLHQGAPPARLASTEKGADATILARFPGRDVAPELEALCVRATAKDPGERIQNARELHDALERFLDGDRDLERRKALADDHLSTARAAFRRARQGGDGGLAARAEAMRGVGRALAFDPESAPALALFARLLSEGPAELPKEAEEEFAREGEDSERAAALSGSRGYLVMIAGFALLCIMGIREWVPAVAHVVFAALAAGLSWLRARSRRPPAALRWEALVFGVLAASMLARLFGPFFAAPGMIATVSVAFAVHVRGPGRAVVVATALAGLLGPAALEALGVLPPSLAFEGGSLVIAPRLTEFPRAATLATLAVLSIASVVAPAMLVGRTSDAFAALKRKHFVSEWQLRQLVPDPARISPG